MRNIRTLKLLYAFYEHIGVKLDGLRMYPLEEVSVLGETFSPNSVLIEYF